MTSSENAGKPNRDGLHIALYAILFTGLLFSLVEYGRMPFETMGLFFVHLSFAILGAILWVMQKVRLFNWQSLLTSVVYGVYAFGYRLSDSRDFTTTMAITAELIAGWFLVMLITDMAVTGRIRNNKAITAPLFGLLVLVGITTLIERNGGFTALAFLYLIALCLIPVTGKEWKKILEGIFVSGLLGFIAVTVFSYIGDPIFRGADEIFMTKADLSQFYAMVLALSLYGIFYAKDREGRLNPLYFFFVGWTAFIVIFILLKGCLSVVPGIILTVVVIVLFAYPIKPLKHFFIRLGVTLAVLALFFGGIWFAAKKMSAPGFDVKSFENVANKAPISYLGDLGDEFTDALYAVQEGEGAVDNLLKPNTPGALINLLTGSRADILSEILPMVSQNSHVISGSGENSYILSIRNQYIQFMYEFGWFYGGLVILLFAAVWIVGIVQYVRSSRIRYLFPGIILAMTLGVWINVSSGVLYPIGFLALISMLPVLADLKNVKKKPVAVVVQESTDDGAEEDSSTDSAEEEDENDMVEGKNAIAAKFFAQDSEDTPKKKRKKAKPVEEDAEEDEDYGVGRPTDRKSLEDVKIMNTSELSGLLLKEEGEEEKTKPPVLNEAGQITEEILTFEQLEHLRELSDETDKEIDEYLNEKEKEEDE